MKLCLFMCCHKSYEIVPPLFTPIQCGAALNSPILGACSDNEGTNISNLNKEYCELTAHYYAWKNVDADFYGFCHYRRFLAIASGTKKPYLSRKKFNEKRDYQLLGTRSNLERLMENKEFDIIAPKSEDMGLSVRNHYSSSAHHFAEDLFLFIEILKDKAPYLSLAAEDYLNQNRQYFCNMFIMSKALFIEYSEILFTTLEEFDRQKTLHGNYQDDRTDGYLGEIFTGIFLCYVKQKGAAIMEVPRLDIGRSAKERLLYHLFPPESQRRFTVKRIAKRLLSRR